MLSFRSCRANLVVSFTRISLSVWTGQNLVLNQRNLGRDVANRGVGNYGQIPQGYYALDSGRFHISSQRSPHMCVCVCVYEAPLLSMNVLMNGGSARRTSSITSPLYDVGRPGYPTFVREIDGQLGPYSSLVLRVLGISSLLFDSTSLTLKPRKEVLSKLQAFLNFEKINGYFSDFWRTRMLLHRTT